MLIYLASPYSHESAEQRLSRFEAVRRVFVELTRRGYVVFAPIVFSHPLVMSGLREWDDPWWYSWSAEFLLKADEVWVLMLGGWDESKGVKNEIASAHRRPIPVRYFYPETLAVNDADAAQ